jgi:hypothetical protein
MRGITELGRNKMTSDEMNDDEIVPDADELPDKCFIQNCPHPAVYEMEDGRKSCDKHYKEK